MEKTSGWHTRLGRAGLVAALLLLAGSGPLLADPPDRYYRGDYKEHRDRGRHHAPPGHQRKHYKAPKHGYKDKYYAPYRRPWYRDIVVVPGYHHWYPGYSTYYYHDDDDDDAYKWLAFTAIAVKLLDNLNEQQQREFEAAQMAATRAPIGETIVWREGGASGAVTAVREGTSSVGRYCREFLQEVTIGGKTEQAYGTACRQPDGAWEVISR